MLNKLLLNTMGAVCIALGIAQAAQAANFEVVANGLDNPRGFTFGPDGDIYVAEAGRGGQSNRCVLSPSQIGTSLCYGLTGAVTRIHNGISERVVTGLPSLAASDGSGSYGPHDIKFDSTGKAYVVVGFAADARDRDNLIGNDNLDTVLAINSLNGGSSWTKVADLAKFELSNDPDHHGLVSNPYSFIIKDRTAYVIDAGANDFLSVGLDGNGVALQAVFPNRIVTNPFTSKDYSMQSVPTSVTIGPDGALYIAELTGFPYPSNEARIYRITPGKEPEVYVDGFTQIIDLVFDTKGNLYVLEYATQSLALALGGVVNNTGALIRVAPDGTRETLASDIVSPNSVRIGTDNAIYISDYSVFPGRGRIIRFNPESLP